MYCDFCGGTMLNTARAGTRWRWECEECGQIARLVYPPYVFLGPASNQVRCRACGETYDWNMPVPIGLFVEGNNAFAWGHYGCGERQADARNELLATLIARWFQLQGYQ